MADGDLSDFQLAQRKIMERNADRLARGFKETQKRNFSFKTFFSPDLDTRWEDYFRIVNEAFDEAAKEVMDLRNSAVSAEGAEVEEIDQHTVALLWALSEPPEHIMLCIYMLVKDDPIARRRETEQLLEGLRDRLNDALEPIGIRIVPDKQGDSYVTNNIVSNSNVYGSIVQGSQDVHLEGDYHINLNEVAALAAAAEQAIRAQSPSMEMMMILLELEKIKGQVAAKNPSPSVITSCLSSVKTVIENLAAGVLTPGSILALQKLTALLP
jgi:hypothetical protein